MLFTQGVAITSSQSIENALRVWNNCLNFINTYMYKGVCFAIWLTSIGWDSLLTSSYR